MSTMFFKSNASNIDWCDHTANPGTGCLHGCSYCYARGLAVLRQEAMGLPSEKPFRPLFHPSRFQPNDLPKKPCRIFLGSMADYGGKWEWEINCPDGETIILPSGKEVTNKYSLTPFLLWYELLTVIRASKHTYMVLTKNPRNLRSTLNLFEKQDVPSNLWIGATVNNQNDLMSHAWELRQLKQNTGINKVFISYEPALEEIDLNLKFLRGSLDWVIVGAQTGIIPFKPEIKWLAKTRGQCRDLGIKSFFKNNLKVDGYPREFPDEPELELFGSKDKFKEGLKAL